MPSQPLHSDGECPWPTGRHGAGSVPRFPAVDEPVDPGQIQLVQRTQGRLIADESHRRGNRPEDVGSGGVVIALDAGAEPDVAVAAAPVGWQCRSDSPRSLGQQLPIEPRGRAN